jgi:serine/threonine protein kinase/formylglycine-generating enzyme required for sulfatase activity
LRPPSVATAISALWNGHDGSPADIRDLLTRVTADQVTADHIGPQIGYNWVWQAFPDRRTGLMPIKPAAGSFYRIPRTGRVRPSLAETYPQPKNRAVAVQGHAGKTVFSNQDRMSDEELTPDHHTRIQSTRDRSEPSVDFGDLDSFELDGPVESPGTAHHTAGTRAVCQFQPGDKLGRYVVISELGTGGFGHVLLCRDPHLLRQVAIKFPRSDRHHPVDNRFLEEGRSIARMDHPSIVRVYDVEKTEDGLPFAVMEYVEGPTLDRYINDNGLQFSVALRLLIQIAEALEYAHSRTLIHRDLKPANVIVTKAGERVKLMDFGMALHDLTPEENLSEIPEGTPPYMAPEQVRGENHRLDRRTDIWGFGTMMYVMLTGQRPFHGKDLNELVGRICVSDPLPPRRVNPDVPRELERICLKCLEKLMNARYQSATELIEDLKMFESVWDSDMVHAAMHNMSGVLPLAARAIAPEPSGGTARGISTRTPSTTASQVKVVPKGLRSFDAQDAEFFLDLLPGPKDRFGIPDSLRFWLNKLAADSMDPLTVGLIFGPSGCGKSSLIKAGLIPRLPAEFKTVYLEATPHETGQALLNRIVQLAPDIAKGDPGVAVALSRIRRGQLIKGQKLLIVIDQFEQWLQAHNDLTDQLLVEALRQCDGKNLSCILLVRDDFWLSASRFMAQLDLKVQDGVNALGIPLFDKRHARKVLTAYGQASEALPEVLTAEQEKFVAATVNEIADHDRIIPIHLALFSQMMDADAWHSSRLKQLGGWAGIGIQFLEKISTDKRVFRRDEALRAVLAALLPPPTSEIKGTQKSFSELAQAAELENKPEELRSLMEYLDRDVRIVGSTETDDDQEQSHYQLTHDFLVAPIRKWIALKEKETWQGRANIRMGELSRQWEMQHDSRFLPGPIEYVFMLLGADRKSATDSGRAFLKAATRYHGVRAAALLLVLVAIGFAGRYYSRLTNARIAQVKVDSLLAAMPEEVEVRLENLEPYDPALVRARLDSALQHPASAQAQLHALLARARFNPVDKVPVAELIAAIGLADKGECRNIIKALQAVVGSNREDELRSTLATKFHTADSVEDRIRLSIVSLFLGNAGPAGDLLQISENPEQRERFVEIFPEWHGAIAEACQIVRSTGNPDLASTLLKSLGQIPADEMSAENRSLLASVAADKIQSAAEPVVFSTCQWLLQQFGQAIPGGLDRASNDSWFVKRFDKHPPLVFLRVEPQLVPGQERGLTAEDVRLFYRPGWRADDTELETGFYMASTEVPASLFYDFLNSEAGGDDEGRVIAAARDFFENEMVSIKNNLNAGLPAYNVKWDEAIVFCNWLSKRDGRSPVYESFKLADNAICWRPIAGASGYQLPTMLQWDAANRTGTRTRFFFGDAGGRLVKYSVTALEPEEYPDVLVRGSAQKLPNGYGFFDLLGNASEWCSDGPTFSESAGYTKPTRGGDANSVDLSWFASGAYFETPVYLRGEAAGIRLVLPIGHGPLP